MFSIMRRLLLAPPPHVAEPERVFRLHLQFPEANPRSVPFTRTSYPFYDLIANKAASLDSVAAYADTDVAVDTGRNDARVVHAVMVSAGFWKTLGLRPASGRFLRDEEAHPATGARVAVLGHAYWQREFGGSTDVLGHTLRIRGRPYEIIGITPRGFRGIELDDVDLWLPFFARADGSGHAVRWHTVGSSYMIMIVARLKPNVTAQRGAAELTSLARSFYLEQYARSFESERLAKYQNARALLGPVTGGLGTDMRPIPEARVTLWLVGIAFILLVIACSNVAGLLLLRAMSRRREIAIRIALGVSRGRLALQLLAESSVLALLGGGAALLAVIWGGGWLQRTILPRLSWQSIVLLDWHVLGVAALCIFGAALAAGMAPLTYARTEAMDGLRDGGLVMPARDTRMQRGLLTVQAALSVVLLVGAGLFMRSLRNAETVDIGVERNEALSVGVDFFGAARTHEQVTAFFERALGAVSAIPTVQHASVAAGVPLRVMFGGDPPTIPGRTNLPSLPTGGPYVNLVTPEFFAATGMRMQQGRTFLDSERANRHAIIVNETMARLYWPGRSPVGQCVSIPGDRGCTAVVGVVADSRRFRIAEQDSVMYYYLPLPLPGQTERDGILSRSLLLRQKPGAPRPDASIREVLRRLDPALPFVRIETLGEALDPEIRPWRLGASVFTAFGTLATILAIVGLWSAVAYAASQRAREFAIRKAIGADDCSLLGLIIKNGLRNAAVGVAAGVLIAGAASPAIADLLFEVSPRDPLVFSAIAAIVIAAAMLASLLAASRVISVDPAVALRAD